MIGNNVLILNAALSHPDNPLKREVKGKKKNYSKEEIQELIQIEYWKHWKQLLMYCEKPHIECSGLGYFKVEMRVAKKRCRNLVAKIRRLRKNNPEKIDKEDTAVYAIHQGYLKEFRTLWNQLNIMRREHIAKMKRINKTLIQKGLEDKIRIRYENA